MSTEDQAQGESTEHHEKRAQHDAEAKGWQVVEVYQLANNNLTKQGSPQNCRTRK
ncbi:MAG: hypothetical protein KZQ89_11615 [Candidatus Thiodiazotropha sp. (ex Lucinoma kastoroae)]|nr:hypothetical protein [Candidatus Thiodiazotropha sp. (ex Lucinoma kastoroae)]